MNWFFSFHTMSWFNCATFACMSHYITLLFNLNNSFVVRSCKNVVTLDINFLCYVVFFCVVFWCVVLCCVVLCCVVLCCSSFLYCICVVLDPFITMRSCKNVVTLLLHFLCYVVFCRVVFCCVVLWCVVLFVFFCIAFVSFWIHSLPSLV